METDLIRLYLILCIAAMASLTGCGSLQGIPVARLPAPIASQEVAFSVERPQKQDVNPRLYEVPGHSIFLQQTSGGSLAVGLLLGPLGVLANSMNIDRLTREMGESGKMSSLYQLDARQEAIEAIGPQVKQLNVGAGSHQVALKPYMVYWIGDEKAGIRVLLHLRAQSSFVSEGQSKPWTGEYVLALKDALPMDVLHRDDAVLMQTLRDNVREGYRELFVELGRDFSSGPQAKRDVAWVQSPILGIGMAGDVESNAQGHMVLRSLWGGIYNLVVFQQKDSYAFGNGPEPRLQN
ncbi:hypothetical protein [Chromobacterium sp. ATCC 53434]|uniref:hypothetical protein n=1 Tax=Chromobacterium sp. (strain ATCC 53434 / SC 14030) TaxID=2059672 RepID=UPI00130523A6|nr:hypothetical protein [Chromobacterium sp. ATCC 53434]